MKLLLKLEATGELVLSERQKRRKRTYRPGVIELTEATEAGGPIKSSLRELGPVALWVVRDAEERRILKDEVRTSSRRLERKGTVRTILGNLTLIFLFHLGTDPERLARRYYNDA